jgi:ribosome-binding factor A
VTQRVAKVESLIQQVVASALVERLERDAAGVTVTRVDAAPDLRNATVWIGLLGTEKQQEVLWALIERERGEIQTALGKKTTMKYSPRLQFKRDTGGEYAAEIDRLLRKI